MKNFSKLFSIFIVIIFLLLHSGCEESTKPEESIPEQFGLLKMAMDISSAPTAVTRLDGKLYRSNFDTIYFDFENGEI
jgi:hypothetical protein